MFCFTSTAASELQNEGGDTENNETVNYTDHKLQLDETVVKPSEIELQIMNEDSENTK